jgi:GMP synthase (glutamine-hydrolysing)
MSGNIAILYCGSSFVKGLYDKLCHLGVTPIMVPHDFPAALLDKLSLSGIIITGSGSYVNDPRAERVDPGIYKLGVPILGICYGMQLMAKDLGGEVKKMAGSESGLTKMEFTEAGKDSVLYGDFADDSAPVWMAHNCRVTKMPDGFISAAKTEKTEFASMEHRGKNLYGLQYHPEHLGRDPSSQAGTIVIWNFLSKVCGIESNAGGKASV